jgi:hypothetical protein
MEHVTPNINAVLRLAGAIQPQVMSVGNNTGTNPSLKSLIVDCLKLIIFAKYMNKDNLAKSDV